ncbi:glycoside hydrolase family 3 C-terminal domain-containing protein [Cellulomonas cellasea]|nr:glycoside hydrolase family 3 C-terminal domain-containing protein [Cellulomonas cellasea]MDM8086349.1 glycoside hydrolase family 3 C-terminal domain-containing protein [Cellulomonas cellasea]
MAADSPTDPAAIRAARAARARALLAELTLDEKTALLHQHAPAIERLGLNAFHTGAEALHGVAWLGTATVFPQPVGLAASWSAELLTRIGEVVGVELRAKHAADPAVSLNAWAPVVNPLRHPRWGRNEEGYSEDPHLTAELATAYARGLRGDHPVFWRTVPTLKHFLAYNNETDRALTSSRLRPRVLREYELPAYRGPLEAGVIGAVMPSYNLVNGRPNHVARELLDELRSWTPESLLVVSDAAAPGNLVTFERYYPDHVTGHAAMLRAGIDSFTDNDADARPTTTRIAAALERGLITEADIDQAALRHLELRLATGELDPGLDPYAGISADQIDLPEHRALAREAVARSVVLLANDGVLPLGPDQRIAVVGPHADRVLHDWYSGTPPYLTGIASALDARLPGAVRTADGADRVALRSTSTGGYLRPGVDGVLLADGPDAGPEAQIDVTAWGEGIVTLRSVATGLLWSGVGWVIRADAERVGGWVAQESFRLHRHDDGAWSLRHLGSGRWLRVQHGQGLLAADAAELADAERFTLRTVRHGHTHVAEVSAAADVVLVAVGNDPHLLGRETEDRPHLRLPDEQAELWRAAREANPRAVLTVVSSYPYALGGLADQAAAVVWTSHAGQELGNGLVDVLVGDVEPSGRLAQGWPADESHVGDLLDYDVIEAKSTYWYAEHPAQYAFGHGLSYTEVEYTALALDTADVDPDDVVRVTVTVANRGERPVDELVQVYAASPGHRLPVPRRRLVAHSRASLAPGETRDVVLTVRIEQLSTWDVSSGRHVVEPGRHELHAGPSSAARPLRAELRVAGQPVPPRAALGAVLRLADYDEQEGTALAERTLDAGDAVQPAPGRRSGWVLLRSMDAQGARGLRVTLARTGPGAAQARVEVRESIDAAGLSAAHDDAAWQPVGTAEAPAGGGRYDWSDVPVTAEPLTAGWDTLAGKVVDVRVVLTGPVRAGELSPTP